MEDDAQRFTYAPLQPGEIRLLYADTSSPTTEWSLYTVQIRDEDAAEDFDALSYTWGDQDEVFPFVCNGKMMHIHRNLHNALPFLARKGSTLPLWIDAICINQADDTEKIQQIGQMSQIYRRASTVWAWLGTATEDSEETIATLRQLSVIGKQLNEIAPLWKASTKGPEQLGLPPVTSSVWSHGVSFILNNPWFDRLWVVQEAALANSIKLLWGRDIIPWDVLENVDKYKGYLLALPACSNSEVIMQSIPSEPNGIVDIRGVMNDWNSRDSSDWFSETSKFHTRAAEKLLYLVVKMMRGKKFECSDPRDRILALLGFLKQYEVHILLSIFRLTDTTGLDSLTTSTTTILYTRIIAFLLGEVSNQKFKTWWNLLGFGGTLNEVPRRPSWVPDLHREDEGDCSRTRLLSDFEEMSRASYYASPHATSFAISDIARGEAHMLGTFFGMVAAVYPELPESCTSSADFLDMIIWKFSLFNYILDAGVQIDQRVYELTLMAAANDGLEKMDMKDDMKWDHKHDTRGDIEEVIREAWEPEQLISESHDFVQGLCRQFSLEPNLSSLNSLRHNPRLYHRVCQAASNLTQPVEEYMQRLLALGRRPIFTTHNHRIGFSTRGVQQGDSLVIFAGAPTPHVIRRAVNMGKETYALIGEAYVNGMMNGEIEHMSGSEAEEVLLV
ncbi:heterokaryon incompatibility protein-domain-containing protein [Lophiotrema nucula]|uniref:Heterokaryon incompatibility protein-domain-containing protein n=1 Tax=Lophiotrema nucula TaxID=690887 RepID=A0A6A5ZXW4_9PLEO|nr:heterokaryon incompatibility protein-domain-containing protein [Lophiotrema nucula]